VKLQYFFTQAQQVLFKPSWIFLWVTQALHVTRYQGVYHDVVAIVQSVQLFSLCVENVSDSVRKTG